MDEDEVVRIRKEMETRRLDMLKLVEESKAKLKELLHAKPRQKQDEPSRPAK